MKAAARIAIILLALMAAGCGGSSAGTTAGSTSTSKAHPESKVHRLLAPIAHTIAHSHQSIAYQAAVERLEGTHGLHRLRQKLVALLPKMTAYVRYFRSVPFPPCLRVAQRAMAGVVARNELMDRGAVRVLADEDEAAAKLYLDKIHGQVAMETRRFQRFKKRVVKRVNEGGDGRC